MGSIQICFCGINIIGGVNIVFLVLIDGILGEFGIVVFEDVESVDVLKDGFVVVIYGMCGMNGVILIIIKQVKGVDINQVEYNGYVSIFFIVKKLDMLNVDEFCIFYFDQDYGVDMDWIDEISCILVSYVYNLLLMGGNLKINYIVNLNYVFC